MNLSSVDEYKSLERRCRWDSWTRESLERLNSKFNFMRAAIYCPYEVKLIRWKLTYPQKEPPTFGCVEWVNYSLDLTRSSRGQLPSCFDTQWAVPSLTLTLTQTSPILFHNNFILHVNNLQSYRFQVNLYWSPSNKWGQRILTPIQITRTKNKWAFLMHTKRFQGILSFNSRCAVNVPPSLRFYLLRWRPASQLFEQPTRGNVQDVIRSSPVPCHKMPICTNFV